MNARNPLRSALTHLWSTSCAACTDDYSVLLCTATNWNRSTREVENKRGNNNHKDYISPGNNRTHAEQGELKEQGISSSTSRRPVQWSVSQFSLLSSFPRRICKPSNMQTGSSHMHKRTGAAVTPSKGSGYKRCRKVLCSSPCKSSKTKRCWAFLIERIFCSGGRSAV